MIGSQPRFFSWYGYTGGCDQVAGIEDNFDQVPGFSPRITALLAQLQNDTSGDLNPACKRMTRAAAKPKVGTRIGSRDSLLKMRSQKVQSNASASAATCPTGQYKVMDFGASGATSTCCPASSRSCAGCASFSGTSCQKCQDGFVIRDGACMACSSSSGWLSLTGRSCFQLAQSECNDEKVTATRLAVSVVEEQSHPHLFLIPTFDGPWIQTSASYLNRARLTATPLMWHVN